MGWPVPRGLRLLRRRPGDADVQRVGGAGRCGRAHPANAAGHGGDAADAATALERRTRGGGGGSRLSGGASCFVSASATRAGRSTPMQATYRSARRGTRGRAARCWTRGSRSSPGFGPASPSVSRQALPGRRRDVPAAAGAAAAHPDLDRRRLPESAPGAPRAAMGWFLPLQGSARLAAVGGYVSGRRARPPRGHRRSPVHDRRRGSRHREDWEVERDHIRGRWRRRVPTGGSSGSAGRARDDGRRRRARQLTTVGGGGSLV